MWAHLYILSTEVILNLDSIVYSLNLSLSPSLCIIHLYVYLTVFSCLAEPVVHVVLQASPRINFYMVLENEGWVESSPVNKQNLEQTSFWISDKLTGTWTEQWEVPCWQRNSTGKNMHLRQKDALVPTRTRVLKLRRWCKRWSSRGYTQRFPNLGTSNKLSLVLLGIVCPRTDAQVHQRHDVVKGFLRDLKRIFVVSITTHKL